MNTGLRSLAVSLLCLSTLACGDRPVGCEDPDTPGATAACLQPNFEPEYYVEQAQLYFDTLDVDAQRARVPNYADDVARWEWPPWLLLTGLGADDMLETASILRAADPSTVPQRDCRFFETQPFARCYIVFEYEEGSCPIYEEFTFDAEGKTTFIEAWSDLPGLLPQTPDDRWAEDPEYPRLATRVPGLGAGPLRIRSDWMTAAAMQDPQIADFAERATDWWAYWLQVLESSPPDYFAQGCGW